jgi:hypothetical protein
MPSFVFSRFKDDNYSLSKYILEVDGSVFLDFIPPLPYDKNHDNLVQEEEKTFEDDEKYVYYTDDYLTVRPKKKILPDGPHSWQAKATNTAGNTQSTKINYLLINSHQANFSKEFFPLTLNGITGVGSNLNNNWQTADYSKTKTYSTTPRYNPNPTIINPFFSLWGIAPFNGTNPTYIRATIKKAINNQLLTINNPVIFQQTTTANPDSQWGINIDKFLSPGDYLLTLESANDKGDFVELPPLIFKIQSLGETVSNQASTNNSVLGENTTKEEKELKPYPSAAPSPSIQVNNETPPKRCLWFWCF